MRQNGFLQWLLFKKWQFFDSTLRVKLIFSIIGILLILLGGGVFFMMKRQNETSLIYSVKDQCKNSTTSDTRCAIQFTIQQQFKQPVKMFYFIENIYINHRKYINSFSFDQLAGKVIGSEDAQNYCYPIVYNKDLYVNKSWANKPLDPNAVASPCGLMAYFYFNDTFKLYDSSSNKIPIKQQGISLDLNKYGNFKRAPNSQSTQWIDPENQHFINWMQLQSLMTKKKLWGTIQQNLPAGNYTIIAENNYKLRSLRIIKGIQFAEGSIFGGKVYAISISLIILGLACLGYVILLACLFNKYENILKHARIQ